MEMYITSCIVFFLPFLWFIILWREKSAIKKSTEDYASNDLQYGEQFPEDAAKWALENLTDIDWNKNALEKAKFYQDQMSMSRKEIKQQLVSAYGEQFTQEQADYAIAHLGN